MNIVILTIDLPEANIVTHRLIQSLGDSVKGIMHSTALMPGRSNADALVYLGRRMGWKYGGAWELHRWLARVGALYLRVRRRPAGVGSLTAMALESGLPLVATTNAHAGSSFKTLQSWRPDLIVSIYFNQVIREPILGLPPRGIINMHPALLPRNRGLMPCFWALANGDEKAGASVHWIDQSLDTGEIIAQRDVDVLTNESVLSLSQRSSDCGAELLIETIDALRCGAVSSQKQNETEMTYYSWPTRGGIRRLYRHGHCYGSPGEMWAQVASPSH